MGAFWFAPGGRRGFGPFGGPGRGGPFGDGPFGDDPFGGRRRQRRGDIKYALLELVAEQPRHGYELIKELESRYSGFYRPSPGTVYPTLQLLEDEGSLESATEGGKRIYTITEAGRKVLADRAAEGERGGEARGPQGRWRSPELEQLREQAAALSMSVMQVARHGSPEQMRAVRTLLENATREIYGVLASPGASKDEQA
jgi:DNA-binding PadR family transcriptional regulator